MKNTHRCTWKQFQAHARVWLAGILLAAMCLSGMTAYAADIPSHTEDFYVNDYAGIFSDEQRERIVAAGEELYDATTAQVVVLTIDTTDGEAISDYALEVGRDWGVGTRGENNGVLIVLAVEDRQVWVAVGYGLEGQLPDSKTGRLIDENAIPYYKNDQFADGTEQLYFAILNEVRQEYGMDTVDVPEAESASEGYDWAGTLFAIGLVAVLLIIVIIIANRPDKKGGKRSSGSGCSGGFDSSSYDSGSSYSGNSGNSGGGGSFGGGGAGRSF